jgi:hypothetical protein
MKRVAAGLVTLALGVLGIPPVALAASSAPRSSSPADESVIVVLKNQVSAIPDTPALAGERTQAVNAAQAQVLAELHAAHATGISPLHLIDAIVATVPPAAARALAADPRVAEVAPNAVFKGPTPVTAKPATRAAAPAAGVCPANGKVQLNPEGVEAVKAVSGNPHGDTARALGFTGAGVTVGDIAVGINPSELELVRPDGQHVIDHYVDFTGEGTSVQGPEDLESYLDDSAIAAQGRRVYDLHDYNSALPKGCDIRLQGVSPGVTLDAYKVYGNDVQTTTSAFLEAIDYAVGTDHVNVLNEEGGSFPMPDTSQDLIKTANDAAMAAGVTITSPSYDAGLESTIWSPSSQPGVISVGASTTFRTYAQDDIGDYSQMHARGWVSDNVSSLSSGGSTEGARTVDVLAPGDLDWIACDASAEACGDVDLTVSGGTSEAGPIVAGVAALVIQAYRSTHKGATPSATLVRDIISSTATDLEIPGAQQGSGLVNAYRAVKAAMDYKQPKVKAADGGPAPVASTQQLSAVGATGSHHALGFTLTNDGTKRASIRLGARTLGPTTVVVRKVVHFTNKTNDVGFHFTLPHGVARLSATIAYPGTFESNPLGISLVNPAGKFTAYSLPQGTGNHGETDVHNASAGRWDANVNLTPDDGTYRGPVYVEITTAPMVSFGSVTPTHISLAPGASTPVIVHATLPARAGDESASVTFDTSGDGSSSLPITLRSLVPFVHGVGHFATTLEGGNGRGEVPAQTFFYQFNVPKGEPALDVQTMLGDLGTDPFYTYLVAPDGEAVAQASNQVVVGGDPYDPVTASESGARLHTISPPSGRWTVIVTFTNPVNGNRLETPLDGTVSFAPVTATTSGLPDSRHTVIAQGTPRTVKVTIRNRSAVIESYFLDARLHRQVAMKLTSITPSQKVPLPLTFDTFTPQWIVPTDTTAVVGDAVSTVPTTFDFAPYNGEPDIGATVKGDDASAAWSAPEITQGDWYIEPQEVGPFGSSGAPAATTNVSVTATTRAFDPSVTTSTGDLWDQSNATFAPVIVAPGQTITLYATITPTARAGSVVRGTLYVDDSSDLSNEGVSPSGDQLLAIPYVYKVGSD